MNQNSANHTCHERVLGCSRAIRMAMSPNGFESYIAEGWMLFQPARNVIYINTFLTLWYGLNQADPTASKRKIQDQDSTDAYWYYYTLVARPVEAINFELNVFVDVCHLQSATLPPKFSARGWPPVSPAALWIGKGEPSLSIYTLPNWCTVGFV